MAFQIRSFFKTSSESDFCELSSKEKEEEEEKEAVHLLRSIDATLGNLLRWSTVVASNGDHNPPPLTVLHFRQLFKALLGDDESDNHKDHSSLKDCSPAVVTQLKLIAATLLTTADCNPSDLLMALLWETSQGLEKIKQTSSDCQMDFSSSINLYRRLDRLAEWLETAGEHLTEWRLRSMASNVAFGIEDAALNGFMAVLTEIDSCLSVFKDSTLQTYRDFRLLEALRQLLDRLTLFADATQNGEFFERVLYSSSDTAHASFALGSLSLRYIQQTLETVGDSAEHRCQEYHHHHQHHYLPNSRAAELIASFDSSAHPKLQARRQEELLACLQPLGQLNSLSLSTDTFYPLWCRDDLDDIDRSEGAKMGLKKAIWVLSSPTHKPKLVAAAFEYFSEDVSLVNSKDNQQNSAKQVDTLLQYVTLQLNAMVIRQHKDSSSSSAKVLASVAENPIFYSALRLVRALLPLPSLNEVSPGTFYHLATLLFALRAAIFGFAVNEAATEVADALFNEENGGGGSTTTAWHSSTTSVNEILYTKMRTDYCCHRNDEEVLNGENARQLPAIIRTHLERVTRECFWSMLLPLMLDDDNDGGQEKEKNEKQNQIDQLDVPLLFSLMEQGHHQEGVRRLFARLQQQQKSQQQNPNLSTSSALLLYSVFESPTGSSVQLLAHLLYLLIVGRVRDQWPLPTATADSTTGVLASMVQHFQRAIYSSGPEMLLSESASGVRACRHGVNVAHPPKKASKEAQQDYCTVLKPVTQDKLCDNLFDGLARLQELFAGLKKCVNDLEKKDKKEGCEMPPESITEELLPWRKKKALAAWKKSRRQQPKLQRELFIKQLGDLSAALCILEQSPKLVEGLGTTGGESTLAAYIVVLTEVVLLLGKVEGNQKSDDSFLC
ncbi:hypothetical protein TYRP_003428 [Tyrophagus putrescentiae]|nr:hypothetical protein TYRP_003428 [Tyrophagus putrescentiae]